MSTPLQIKIIHTLRGQIPGLAEDEVYRDFLENVAGKRSSKDLSEDGARQVLRALEHLRGGQAVKVRRPADPKDEPKTRLIGRILREAYEAGWDRPEAAGAFDATEPARRQRVRERVVAWLSTHHPHLHGTPQRLEAWPMEALQGLMEHVKGVNGAQRRWAKR
ncbi:regulatory protein GemA [Geothrix fuzhouensis]|uniref:regulatory protein GemA n=1 Tax=Geothrix fuzhouensis TaxID=2966451 RepID=UPI0021478330|nr:regulatory protein GemA [Geothrix fuzhouensis]